MKAPHLLVLFNGLLFAFAWLLPYPPAITNSVLAAAVAMLVWQAVLFVTVGPPWRGLSVQWSAKKPHYVQTILQSCLYIYWGLYWDEVRGYAPLLIVQILFAYLFDLLLAWTRQRVWHFGFGQIPIILSINLFIWFRPDYYMWQFVLIALAYLGKEFVTWTYAGKKKHIFNPSAFSLASVSAILMVTETYGVTRAFDIVESFMLAPNFYEVIFLLSLVVQFLFGTTLVTFSGMLALCGLFFAAEFILGVPLFEVAIGHSVFLGLTLLVTDPSTSPRSKTGKLMFGLTYGAGIFFLCILFHLYEQPTVFDKILMVPVVNLLAPAFDRLGAMLHRGIESKNPPSIMRYDRFAWIALYVALFLVVLPGFKRLTWVFESPLPHAVGVRSEQLDTMLFNAKFCQLMYPDVYLPFGFSSEYTHYDAVAKLLEMDRAEVMDEFAERAKAMGIPAATDGMAPPGFELPLQ